MKLERHFPLGCLLAILCVLASGCASFNPLGDWADDRSHHNDVGYYEGRGLSPENAERAADEQEFFQKMDEESGYNK